MARVAFVIASHSDLLARGVVELASQMAPDVTMKAAGGTDDGRIGTSYERIEAALEEALASVEGSGSGVVILTDLGSATMTVESVIEMSDEESRIRFVDTSLVEGAIASAVRAQLGDPLDQVADIAASLAPRMEIVPDDQDAPAPQSSPPSQEGTPTFEAVARAVIADPVGLHARPAAQFVRLASTFDAQVEVDGADGGSVLELMALGAKQGHEVTISAVGADATAAVAALKDMLETLS